MDDNGPADTAQASGTPAIAVLPFENLSQDVAQAYFADGLAERIVGPLDPVLDRGDFAMRHRSVGLAAEFGAGEVMRLAGRSPLDEDR